MPLFVYPFITWWTFGLFQFFGYYEQCCSEHLCTSSRVDMSSPLVVMYLGEELLGHMAMQETLIQFLGLEDLLEKG